MKYRRSLTAALAISLSLVTLAAATVADAPLTRADYKAGIHVATSQQASPAGATGCAISTYRYALQFTATDTAQDHNECNMGTNAYAGWIGIDGQIQTPTSAPHLGSEEDHNVGWIGANWMHTGSGDGAWVQVGWYTGFTGEGVPSICPWAGHCIKRTGTYGMYVEFQDLSGHYEIYDLGQLSLGQLVTYRIEFVGNGCWQVYVNYNAPIIRACNLPNSGSMWAVNELANFSGTAKMATSWFGTSAGGTNQTLRLKGSRGWQDWNQSIQTGGTRQMDLRNQPAGKNYYMSSGKLWWYLKTFQG